MRQLVIRVVNINRIRARVTRRGNWDEEQPVVITWDPVYLGVKSQKVAIQLARYSMRDNGDVFLHSMYTLTQAQRNTGRARLFVLRGLGTGHTLAGTSGTGRFITLVRVERTGSKSNFSSAEWIWSDLFAWPFPKSFTGDRCLYWYRSQPNPKKYTDDASLLPCPQTLPQAKADRGRFVDDEYCNPNAKNSCRIYHNGATHCLRTNIPSNQGAGQQCCYNQQGNLPGARNGGGSLDRFHIEAGVPVFSHFFNDLVPYLDCCLLAKTPKVTCEKYFEKRPSDNGSAYVPPRPAVAFGDPHMITLDGVEYTFNGYGEYHILQVAGPDFNLQGRMQPLIDEYGNVSRATVYTAFAMKETNSDVVQVQISGLNEIEIVVNGDIVEFNEELMMDFNGVIVMAYNNTEKYSTIFNSGISVTVEKADKILQVMLIVPPLFKGNTSGLLGLWDGNQDQEFLLPNGTFLETNSSHRRIHNVFGRLWATTANNSLFTYPEGKSHQSYFDVNYMPNFLDQGEPVFTNATLGQQARAVCGDNKQCLFDIQATGNVNIGRASRQAAESFIAVVNDTESVGCTPIENTLMNGNVLRNDTEEGRVIYRFRCDPGFNLNGSTVISCFQGHWNASMPNCHKKFCDHALLGPNGTFSTPKFPQDYPKNIVCVWRVNLPRSATLRVRFEQFYTEGCCDFLAISIRNGSVISKLSGNHGSFLFQPITAVEDNTVIVLNFTSDGSVSKRGFIGYYSIVTAPTTASPSTPVTTTRPTTSPPFFGCGGMLNGTSGSFGTPGFAGSYDNNLDCVWNFIIPADGDLGLNFRVFHTEQCCDFVELLDSAGRMMRKYSGLKSAFVVRVYGNTTRMVKVRFESDSSTRRSGFLVHYIIKSRARV